MASLTSLSPTQKPAGSGDFVLICNGTLFLGVRTSPDFPTIIIDGTEYPTTCTDGRVCSCTVPAAVIAAAGTLDVWVNEDVAGDTGHLTFTVTSPLPIIDSISPTSASAGSSVTIAVVGHNFTAGSVITVDGVTKTTTFTDAQHIATTATVAFPEPGAEHVIGVSNPGIGDSNGAILTINNPVPTFSSLSPVLATVGDPSFTLTINGGNFVHGIQVSGAGILFAPTWVSASQITVQVQQSGLTTAGVSTFTITNPSPGGGSVTTGSAFTVNNPTPTISSISPSSGTAGTGPLTVTVTGSGFVSGATNVNFDGSPVATTFLSGTSVQFTVTTSMLAVAGVHPVTVTNIGPGGGTTSSLPFTVSGGTPVLNNVSPDTFAFGASTYSFDLIGEQFPSTGWAVLLNGEDFSIRATYVSSTRISVTLLAADVPKAAVYILNVYNAPDNTTSNPQYISFSNPVPTTSALSSSSKVAGSAAFSETVTGTGFLANAGFNSGSVGYVNGSPRTTTYTDSTHVAVAITAQDLASTGSLSITVVNPGPGGGSSNAQTLSVVNPSPVFTSVSPSTVLLGSGNTTVTVSGSGFVSASVVKIGATSLTTTYVSANTLTAIIPSGNLASIATLSLTVFNPTPGGGTSGAQTVAVVNPAPSITSLSPNQKNAGDATYTQTVNGTGFRTGNSTASWNGQTRTTTVVSSTQLTFSVLASDITSVGSNSVTVTNATPGGGTSSAAFLNVGPSNPSPTLTSTSPTNLNQGSSAQSLTVTGTNFVPASIVRWEGNNRVTTYVSATTLTVALQSNDLAVPGSHAITVFNPTPGGGTSSAVGFVVNALNPVPTITSLSPPSVVQGASGFTLTINGTNFLSTSTASFGGVAKTVTFVGATQITISILAGDVATAGTLPVIVTNPGPGGGSTPATNFVVNAPATNPTPSITNLSVRAKNVGDSGFTLTVTGTGFVSTIQGKWAGSNRTTVFSSATSLTIAITTADLAAVGNFAVTVTNPTPGGGTSNAFSFAVNALVNPVPFVQALSPPNITRGSGTFQLSLFGVNFIPTTVATFNGANKTTAYVSPTRVDATVPDTDIALSPGAVSRINPEEHHEVGTMNASNVRTYDAGSAIAPALTGPNAKVGVNFPEDRVEIVSGGVTSLRVDRGLVTI